MNGIVIDLPRVDEVVGISKLDVLKKMDLELPMTDLAVLTGGSSKIFVVGYDGISYRTCSFYTKSFGEENAVYMINTFGNSFPKTVDNSRDVIRPVLRLSSSAYTSLMDKIKENDYGVLEVKYGEYPQYAVNKDMQDLLTNEYNNQSSNLKETGKVYTFNDVNSSSYCFSPITYPEYLYNNKKYIRIKVNDNISNHACLSNGECYFKDSYVWIEVSPVTWLVDTKTKTLVSKNGLLSGIRVSDINSQVNMDFKRTEMYEYLQKYMFPEIETILNVISDNELSFLEGIFDQISSDDKEAYLEALKSLKKGINPFKKR